MISCSHAHQLLDLILGVLAEGPIGTAHRLHGEAKAAGLIVAGHRDEDVPSVKNRGRKT